MSSWRDKLPVDVVNYRHRQNKSMTTSHWRPLSADSRKQSMRRTTRVSKHSKIVNIKHSKAFLSNGDETTPRILMQTIKSTRPNFRSLPGFEDRPVDVQDRISSGLDCDEVYPNIFIGDAGAAKDKVYLKKIGVTHILNTAEGNRFGMVNTSHSYYKDTEIKYMGVELADLPLTDIGVHFHETADFIEEGVKNGGKVMVHCLMGMSRSSTCVLSYLMIKEGLCATEALRTVRTSRDIRPNEGFLRQLADLDNKLRRDRERASNNWKAIEHTD